MTMIYNKEITMKLLNLELTAMKKAYSLCDKIIEIVPKFNDKQPNKRFDTALKAIDKGLSFKTQHNSFIIEMYIEDRHFNINSNAYYLKDSSLNIIYGTLKSSSGDGICQDNLIIAENLIKEVEKVKVYKLQYINQLESQLKTIDDILTKFHQIENEIEGFNTGISYRIREYFGLKFH